jgi:ABC-type antimicrobial peptide transport system permease subunit
MAAAAEPTSAPQRISEQAAVPWSVIFQVSLGSLRRRLTRSFVAMSGIILAIAFLCYMLVTNEITHALIALNDSRVNWLLQQSGVDPMGAAGADLRMYILIGLSLLTCLVGIMNAMLMSVTERVKEIGTLKCLGALDSFIVKTFFVESLLQGVLGTLAGIVLGVLVGLLVSGLTYKSYALAHCPWLRVLLACGVAFVVGSVISMLASIAPAYWAARKQPVEALRVEE